ncbi:MAG: sigma-70 family RNA polymerase sigma factor [Bifidobacteriaceae bacterium]|nr:sigma-70 family RNA polymerase sigma factor [Bifidobacteriaceae bacterium]
MGLDDRLADQTSAPPPAWAASPFPDAAPLPPAPGAAGGPQFAGPPGAAPAAFAFAQAPAPGAAGEPLFAAPATPDALTRTEAVIARHGDMVHAVAATHTACRGDAEDVFQEVFLAYHRVQPRCHSEEHRKAWLLRTTLNIARRVATSSWRMRVVPLTADDPPAPAAAAFTFATERQDAIFRAMSRLTESARTVLHLFYFEDLPVAEIAQLLDLSPAAVKMRLSRGRSEMRDQLREEIFDE